MTDPPPGSLHSWASTPARTPPHWTGWLPHSTARRGNRRRRDELRSPAVAARPVRDLMRLCLLMDRRCLPYSKWLGSAFARTPRAAVLTPVLTTALTASDWHIREHHLACAYEIVAAAHNRLSLTDPVDPTPRASTTADRSRSCTSNASPRR
ncbi:DUF4037 domain-containing protein [Streptomyces monashensis]|uniref:DUF4037 domain-containing protein n=1 Tax=Streptomyces monashensis TaxID=1678012 RepID=UPI003CCB7417